MENTKDKVRKFIEDALAEAGQDKTVDDDTSLIVSGLLESLMVVSLIVFAESEFHIDFSGIFFDQNMFDSINEITEFIEKHKPQ